MEPLQMEDLPRQSLRRRSSCLVKGRSSSVALHDAASRLSASVYLSTSGLSVMQATLVAFNSAVGCTVALIGYYPKQCGWQGFAVIMSAVAVTAAVQQSALISTSCQLGAGTFDELCQPLPGWSTKVTVASFLLYFWSCTGFYCQFVEVFLADQICKLMCERGSSWLCESEYRIAFLVFVFFALVSWPPQLNGSVAVCINYLNFLVKWVVIVTAIVKGIYTATQVEAERSYTAFVAGGAVRTSVLLMGSFANTGIMPQIAVDIDKSQQERAAKLCPIWAVSLQFLVYLALAYSAYFALGDDIQPTVFATYNQLYPDIMTTILQGGMALLTFFSSPLLIIPLKAQICGLLLPGSDGERADLTKAPASLQGGLTLILAFTGAMAPCIVGPEAFTRALFFLSSTCGNWLNFFLPAMVVLYCQVLSPNYKGKKWLPTFLCCWLFFLGGLGLVDAGFQIQETLSQERQPGPGPIASRCAAWRLPRQDADSIAA